MTPCGLGCTTVVDCLPNMHKALGKEKGKGLTKVTKEVRGNSNSKAQNSQK
jgi:hypothetical protein